MYVYRYSQKLIGTSVCTQRGQLRSPYRHASIPTRVCTHWPISTLNSYGVHYVLALFPRRTGQRTSTIWTKWPISAAQVCLLKSIVVRALFVKKFEHIELFFKRICCDFKILDTIYLQYWLKSTHSIPRRKASDTLVTKLDLRDIVYVIRSCRAVTCDDSQWVSEKFWQIVLATDIYNSWRLENSPAQQSSLK